MNLIRFGLAAGLCFSLTSISLAQDPVKPVPVPQSTAKPETATPEPAKPEPVASETATPEPATPEPVASETAKPESAQPASDATDASTAMLRDAENDTSYWLLGEFIGEVNESGDDESDRSDTKVGGTRMGLQLRPVGDTDFDAQMFEGGLPGEGESFVDEPTQDPISTPREPMRLVGRRSGKTLVLSGGPFAIFVDAGGCTLIDPSGKKLGRLKRVSRASASLGATPPDGAIALFGQDGDTSMLVGAKVAPDGTLKQGFSINPMIQDFDLHVEFRTPYMPAEEDQKRGNSGIYIHGRYEMQILDSFAQDPKYNHLGSIYKAKSPDVNMALPPLSWQTYDVRFTAARFNADGTKYSDARVTSWVNGVKVQNDVTLANSTGRGKPEEPLLLPILLQDHHDEVRFRNLWIIDRGLVRAEFPVKGDGKQPPLVMEEKAAEAAPAKSSNENQAKTEASTKPSQQTEVKKVSASDALPLATPITQGESQVLPAPIVK